jgi:hypothetical protein
MFSNGTTKEDRMGRKRIEFFVPGFLWTPIVAAVRFIHLMAKAFWIVVHEARKHPVFLSIACSILVAGALLTFWGAGHLSRTPSRDVAIYNNAVGNVYLYRVEIDPSAYCYDEGFYGGGYYSCPTEEEIAKIVLNGRIGNLAQKDKFSEVANLVKDPRIHSRALYNKGTVSLRDAMDFKDKGSLDDSILAFQDSLRDDPSYLDAFGNGGMDFARDKRINLEVALRIREVVNGARAGDGSGDGESEVGGSDTGFGAGKSNDGRRP